VGCRGLPGLGVKTFAGKEGSGRVTLLDRYAFSVTKILLYQSIRLSSGTRPDVSAEIDAARPYQS